MSNYLMHYGVKGMKWGVRKAYEPVGDHQRRAPVEKARVGESTRIVRKLKKPPKAADYTVRARNGDLIEMRRDDFGLLAKGLRKLSPKIAAEQDKTRMYNAYVNGKKVGDIQLYKESDTSVNVVWLSVKSREQGKGYAQAILESSTGRVKAAGFKQMTLEVPGESPDARHIYEKQGFVAGKQISSEDDVWGGLTKMKKKLRD